MIARYHLLAERLRTELQHLEQAVVRTEGALAKSVQQPQDQDDFIASAALNLHGFYAGLEHLFAQIADNVDGSVPKGSRWHQELLLQMTLAAHDVRPIVLSDESYKALEDYLDFRHVVRNVYTFNLKPQRVSELVRNLRPTFDMARRDLLVFADFLAGLATADEPEAN